ncbi:MAG TPA: Mut7-C RNAse domain-containing protein [Candidatus Thermoplasmatota archaeon]
MDRVEKFLCDGMLGAVARWLRLMGYDAAYAGSTATDTEVLERAEREGRFLATRDLELVQRALRAGIGVLLLKEASKEEQVLLLLMHAGATLDPARFFTRCTECGELLAKVSKDEVLDKIPPAVAEAHSEFWRCPGCAHVYWHGSHVTEIEKKILDMARRIAATT